MSMRPAQRNRRKTARFTRAFFSVLKVSFWPIADIPIHDVRKIHLDFYRIHDVCVDVTISDRTEDDQINSWQSIDNFPATLLGKI
jgi:hypothetical protein